MWEPTDAELDDAEVSALWTASGARWLTDPAVAVPGSLTRRVVGLVAELDHRGAALADLVDARGLGLLAERAAAMGLPPSDRTSAGGAARLLRAADGWFAISLARPDDLAALPAWFDGEIELPVDDHDGGSDGLIDGGTARGGIVSDGVWRAIERAAAIRRVRELGDRATLLGLPCSVVEEVSDTRAVIADRVGDASPRPLEGALVVSLAALWAGPLCADVLARLGARVVTVESTRRPDGGRLARRFFEVLHGRSESVALDLASPAGRTTLAALLRRADVVIEGSRPRALEQMGIDARDVVGGGPQVWLSITAHGRGPHGRERVGFGDDAAAAGGLVGWNGDEPRFLADAVGDPLAGLTAACAIAFLVEQGGRWLVDVALARVAASARGGWIDHGSEASVRPRTRRDRGGPMPIGRDTVAILGELGIVTGTRPVSPDV